MVSVDSSPGPQYHVDAKMTRFGRDGTPSYSMLGKKKKTGGFSSDLMLELSPFLLHRSDVYEVNMQWHTQQILLL